MKKIIINCFRFLCLIIQIVIFCSCETQPEIVSVTNKNEKQKLTLMIYMAADNDLETYALQNLKMLEQAEFEKINVIVLLDRAEGYDETDGNWTDTRLYEVQSDKSPDSSIKSKRLLCPQLGLSYSEPTELDMSNPSVLKNFIDF